MFDYFPVENFVKMEQMNDSDDVGGGGELMPIDSGGKPRSSPPHLPHFLLEEIETDKPTQTRIYMESRNALRYPIWQFYDRLHFFTKNFC